MADRSNTPSLVTEDNLQAFFHDSIKDAARSRRLDTGDATLHYLTHLLADYAKAERLFDQTGGRPRLRPLAMIYQDALQAPSVTERRLWLQRLGDLALFVAGWFSGRLSRRLTDLDYCIAMGGNAYGYLHETTGGSTRDRALREIFGELAQGFDRFVDLLASITRQAAGQDHDVLDLYGQWLATGSPALGRRLQALGVDVGAAGRMQ